MKGSIEGQARTILAFLEARSLAVSREQPHRILASTDPEELDRWARQAAAVPRTEDLFID